ncbi:MAG: hypothetical protein OEW42_16395 [Acidimicrobiia bacterium]|nr:hypothetical protein [Acidimicrobiia bacterium]MDH5238074.1 hypothetical protein [Acidimicrobiia bacterium]
MRRLTTALLLSLALLAGACGSSDDDAPADASTTSPSTTTDTGDESADDGSADADTGAEEDGATTSRAPTDGGAPVPTGAAGDGGADPGFEASLDDPTYVNLILDCVYGENEGGSCEMLEDAGLLAEDGYGLGNSVSQAPDEAMRADCVAGIGIGCAELNARVQAAMSSGEVEALLCFFHDALTSGQPDDIDAFYLGELLGTDAPAGVAEALNTLTELSDDADAIATVDAYVGPICA